MSSRKIYWAGRQWCVTDMGLETIKLNEYAVEAARLGDLTEGVGRDQRPGAERLRHIGTKTWVDVEDLAAAFAVALQVHHGQYAALPKGAFHNTLADLRYGKVQTEIYRELRHDSSSVDLIEGFELLEKAQKIMAERYPDGSEFYQVKRS